jgi:hypothetical protein
VLDRVAQPPANLSGERFPAIKLYVCTQRGAIV